MKEKTAEDHLENGSEVISLSGLCTRYARLWPREVIFDGTVEDGKKMTARSRSVKSLLTEPGVYVLYRDDIPYYIGQAKRLQARLWRHAWDPNSRHYNFWNFFSAFVSKDPKHMDDVEAILIAAMPTANSARPRIERAKIPLDVVRVMRDLRRSRAKA